MALMDLAGVSGVRPTVGPLFTWPRTSIRERDVSGLFSSHLSVRRAEENGEVGRLSSFQGKSGGHRFFSAEPSVFLWRP